MLTSNESTISPLQNIQSAEMTATESFTKDEKDNAEMNLDDERENIQLKDFLQRNNISFTQKATLLKLLHIDEDGDGRESEIFIISIYQ
jgi:hypothetical protein